MGGLEVVDPRAAAAAHPAHLLRQSAFEPRSGDGTGRRRHDQEQTHSAQHRDSQPPTPHESVSVVEGKAESSPAGRPGWWVVADRMRPETRLTVDQLDRLEPGPKRVRAGERECYLCPHPDMALSPQLARLGALRLDQEAVGIVRGDGLGDSAKPLSLE